jgi:hypothetical protein
MRHKRTHKTEVAEIRKLVEALGGTCNVLHQGCRCGALHGSAGLPDLYLQFPRQSRAAFFEVKVGKDKMRSAQTEFRYREQSCGHIVLVGDLGDLESQLRAWGMLK